MAITIRDIAREAHVTIGTVSRALKNQPGMSEATRLRIVEAARRLGYDVGRRRPQIRRLAVLLHRQHNRFAATPFFSPVLSGVEEACRAHSIAPSLLTASPADDIVKQLRLHAPDAIVVAGHIEPETLAALDAMQRPLVLIDVWAPNLPSVNLDNAAGAALAMQHLFALNRTRVAFIGSALPHHTITQRALGYRRAYFEAGLLLDPSLEVTIDPSLPPETGAERAMQRLLDAPGAGAPDAVFAYNDTAALAALRVCLARGLRVPEDIAIVGFDDIPAAGYASPALTTIAADKVALGTRGVELLLSDVPAEFKVLLPVRLVTRATTLGDAAAAPAVQ